MGLVRVKITQDHIIKGTRASCSNCPVALALRDATGIKWFVSQSYLGTVGCYNNIEVKLPPRVSVFISSFDLGVHVEPFEFDVQLEESK